MVTILETMIQKLKEDNKVWQISMDFGQMVTNEDRIKFVLNIMSKYSVVPPNISKEKNAADAKIFREEGNKIFVKNPITDANCRTALKLYTQSMAYSPCSSTELSLAYGNRSAVLLSMCKYRECIEDIDKALALDYPEHLKIKVYIRRIECLMMLDDPNAAEACDETQKLLSTMSIDDVNREKFETKLKILCEIHKNKNSQKQNMNKQAENEHSKFEHRLKSHNSEAFCASDSVTIKYTKEQGRHIVASRKIYPGEVIAIEKPYSLLLKIPCIYTHCANCFKMQWSSISCSSCVYAIYCSEKCKAEHWRMFHDVECSVFGHLIQLDCVMLDLFSLRLAVQAVREVNCIDELRNETKEVEKWSDPRTVGFSSDGKLHSDKYRAVYGLVTNVEKRLVRDLFRRTLDACCILFYIATRTTFFGCKLNTDTAKWIDNKNLTFVGSLILQHQMSIPTNMHDFVEVDGLTDRSYAIGALPFCSFLNHSCGPNISRYSTRDQKMVVYALHTIKKGEQLFDTYGQHYAVTHKKQRQQKLLQQYRFNCECLACTEDWPIYFHLERCKTLVTNQQHQKKIYTALEKFQGYMQETAGGDISSSSHIVEDLLKMIEVLCEYAPMPCVELSDVTETLKQVYHIKYGNNCKMPTIHG